MVNERPVRILLECILVKPVQTSLSSGILEHILIYKLTSLLKQMYAGFFFKLSTILLYLDFSFSFYC